MTPMTPTCAVLLSGRRFAGSTEWYVYAATELKEFFVAFGRHKQNDLPIGYGRFVRCREEVIAGIAQGIFELQEVLPASSPAPHPVVSLSGVLWTRRAARAADQSIAAFLAAGGPNLEV